MQSILKAKKDTNEKNVSKDMKRNKKAEFSGIDDAVYKWYCLGQERNILISGPMLQEETHLICAT